MKTATPLAVKRPTQAENEFAMALAVHTDRTVDEAADRESHVSLFPYGVSRNKIERAIANMGVNASIARKWDDADVVLSLKTLERKDAGKLKSISAENVPIYSIKTNTTAQIMHALKDIFNLPSLDAEEIALKEAGEAIYKVLLESQPIELSPQSSYVRRLQHQLAEQHRIQSRSTGAEPNRRLILLPRAGSAVRHGSERVALASARFVSVEGIEASGKSTLVSTLASRLRDAGFEVVTTREPGGTTFGDRARAIFLDPAVPIDPIAEVLLLNASRAQLVADVVRPALRANRWVLTDRFSLATLAYQGYGRGLDPDVLERVAAIATDGLVPDRTLVVDVPVDVSRARVRSRAAATGVGADRLEREDAAFHERVRAGYLALAAGRDRASVLDGTLSPVALADAAWYTLFAESRV